VYKVKKNKKTCGKQAKGKEERKLNLTARTRGGGENF
jgi:hypothetical protein